MYFIEGPLHICIQITVSLPKLSNCPVRETSDNQDELVISVAQIRKNIHEIFILY